jgi:hypothetical protein
MLINLSLLQSYEKVERNAKENIIFLFISETKDSKLVSLGSSKNFGEANVLAKSKRRKRRATKKLRAKQK